MKTKPLFISLSLCLTSVLLWLLSGPSEAVLAQTGSGIIRVAPPPTGNDVPNCGGEANLCHTVQHVVDLAQSGSEILIASSTHTGVRAREGMLPPILGPLSEMGKYPRPDTITIIVRDDVTGDYETLTLTELGNNVGVFRNVVGLLPSTSGMLTPNNGELETGAGHTIVALYTDDDPSDTSSDDARMTGTGASDTDFTDSGGTEAAAYIIGVDGIYVTVQDGDENTNSSVGDTVSVLVTDSGTGDSETLTLTETGPNTGVFRNTGGLPSSSGAGSSGDATLNTKDGHTITAVYVDDDDPGDTSSDAAIMLSPPTASLTRFTDSEGSDVTEYGIGVDGIYVTVDDTDENTDSLTGQEISIIVTDSATGDSETLILTETGPNTGLFRNTVGLPSTPGTPNPENGELETGPGHTIFALYADDDDPSDVSSDNAKIGGAGASDTDFTDSGGTEVDTYIIGMDGIYVTVTDGDENVNSGLVETVLVAVFNNATGDTEQLILTETGPNTGLFRNTVGLPSTDASGSSNDGTLNTGVGHTITVEYMDDDDPGDTSSDMAIMLAQLTDSAISFTDSAGADVDKYIIGMDGIYVTVQDGDENTNSSVGDTVSVLVTDSGTGDSETLTLTETGDNTGVFRNTVGLSSSSGVGSSDDGTLNTAVGNTIAVEYTDNDDPSDTSSDTATVVNPPIYLPVVLRQYPQGER